MTNDVNYMIKPSGMTDHMLCMALYHDIIRSCHTIAITVLDSDFLMTGRANLRSFRPVFVQDVAHETCKCQLTPRPRS